jgi:hypothetical protein
MTYYDNYDADAEYAKEVYWESKGMGNASPSNTPIAKPVSPKFPCWRCGRYGTSEALKLHNERYPNCNG